MWARWISRLGACAALALGACGGESRPGALAPGERPDAGPPLDVRVFVPPDAVPLRPPPSCGGTRQSLTQRRASVMLVIDRSGSMSGTTTDGVQIWQALLNALGATLPRVDAAISLGLVLFPEPYRLPDGVMATEAQVCGVSAAPVVSPAPGNAARVLAALRGTLPGGATPTHAAIEAARRWFDADPDRSGERYLLLATDGGPNCNTIFDPATCVCTGNAVPLCRNNVFGRINCLDADRTVETVSRARDAGITTLVLGLNGTQGFASLLDAMAVAGGRPRAATPRYYDVASAADLARELGTLASALASCRFTLDAAPVDPDLVDLRLDGMSLIRDPMRRDGWEYADEGRRVIEFYGSTCDRVRAASGGSQLVAAFGCPAPLPP